MKCVLALLNYKKLSAGAEFVNNAFPPVKFPINVHESLNMYKGGNADGLVPERYFLPCIFPIRLL